MVEQQVVSKYKGLRALMFIGAALIIAGVLWGGWNWLFFARAEQADGVVVDMVRMGKGYAPVVEFQTTERQQVRFQSWTTQNPPAYQVGDQITVYYNQDAPATAKLRSFWLEWFGPLMLIGFGILDCFLYTFLARKYLENHPEMRSLDSM